MTAADDDRAWLIAREIFLADQAAMFAGRHPHANRILGMNRDAIGADIHPTRVRVAHDDNIFRADIATAIKFMHERCGELQKIDFIITQNVFEDRSGLDLARRGHFELFFHARFIGAHDIDTAFGFRQTQNMGEALIGIRRTREHTKTFWIAGDIVEENGRLFARIFHGHLFSKRAHFQMRICPVNLDHFAHALEIFKKIAHAFVRGARIDASA